MKKTPSAPLLTRPELAAHFHVVPGTVTRWEADGMPTARKAGRGRHTLFDAIQCAAWREARDAEGATEHLSLERARARHALAQAQEAEQRVALRAKTLVLAADVEQTWAAQILRCRTKLLGLPRKMKARRPQLVAADIKEIDLLIREALEDLARG